MKQNNGNNTLGKFEEYLQLTGNSKWTIKNYTNDVRQFLSSFRTFNEENVQNFLNGFSNPATRARKHSSLLAFAKFIGDKDALNTLRNIHIRTPEKLPKPIPLQYSKKVVESAMLLEDKYGFNQLGFAAVICLMVKVGLRASEALSLTTHSFNLKEKTFRVMGKGNKERVLPIPRNCLKLIKTAIEKRELLKDGENLYMRGYRTFANRVKELGEMIGLPELTSHMLRHTAATIALKKSGNLRAVQKLLGHKTPKTTARYTKVTVEDLREIIET